jgi:hypothetical protein
MSVLLENKGPYVTLTIPLYIHVLSLVHQVLLGYI